MFKNLTIGKKLAIGFGVVIASVILLEIVTLLQLNQIRIDINDIDERLDKLHKVYEVKDHVKNIIATIPNYILAPDNKAKEELMKTIDENRAKYKEKLEDIKKITHTEEGKKTS